VERYYIKQLKKCHLKMPDSYSINLHSLAKNAPPDYTYEDSRGFVYIFNICRNTIMTCNGKDESLALQYFCMFSIYSFNSIEGQCTSELGKFVQKVDYIDKKQRNKGFKVTYSGGDFCHEEGIDRKSNFIFNCDPSIDFEVRSVDELKCIYTFNIYSNKVCDFFPPGHTPAIVAKVENKYRNSKSLVAFVY
jgi:hypothetical protein